ncbi:mitogen-activated protein kinase kinase kinase 18-like [Zingiber officinale]|uniref:mitogen-activated protein kinase kinase kinase 18-like n=1 Tax=Zingiber officinale TaxID=94328 RepID=UPI001C4BA6B1|nr:mitogen-activated protein kinase kinase kinase 18-like [Zingiber officinale]
MESAATSWVRGRRLGIGAHAVVHLAVDNSTGHVFAVKSVGLTSSPLASLLSLENEIQILKSLRSPYVVSYLGDDTVGGRRDLHLEFMPSGTAADAAMGDELRVRAYARCVAHALRYLHDVAGVVHCDVKGRNVLLHEGGGGPVAKLADFGVAVRLAAASGGWVRGGTPLWMAPEVARGERPTPAADVWSLGCTVIEMATGGASPWPDLAGEDAVGAMLRIGYGEGTPELPAQLSEVGRDFIAKCLNRDARERWTAEQLLSHPFLAKQSTETEPSPRGVLEWTNNDDDDAIKEFESIAHNHEEEGGEIIAGARERLRELASGGGDLSWWPAGWELVRGAEAEEGEEENRQQRCSVSCCRCNGCNLFQSCCWWCWHSDLIFGVYHLLSHLLMIINIILHSLDLNYLP